MFAKTWANHRLCLGSSVTASRLPITDFLVHDRFPMSLGQKKIGGHLCIIKKFQNSLYHCNF